MTALPAAVGAILIVLAALFGMPHAPVQDGAGVLTEYFTGVGSPFRVCAQTPEIVWFTLPEQNSLGRLALTPEVAVQIFQLPTPASQPYDIACRGDYVWVTERAGNKIARFDPLLTSWTEYTIATPSSEPTGLDVRPGDPTEVWFAERTGNKIGRLVVPILGEASLTEYPSPMAGTLFQDIDLAGEGIAWFTAPGTNQIGRFNLNVWPSDLAFAFVYTGVASEPWNISVEPDAYPWFTDRAGNRIGHYDPGTLTLLRWIGLPVAGSNPYAIEQAGGQIWFTEMTGQRVGRLGPLSTVVRELLVPGSSFTGLSFDGNMCGWLADSAQNQLVRWCAPYFHPIYLPLIAKG